MRLQPNTRLGPHQIRSLIGAGGMGEVYRARDERLSRDVAIKVLPATFSQDSERLRRFEQEARAVGMLNHPNILTIYDIGTHDGSPYVVSELLEGETLRARLAGSSLPVHKAIDYALQMARGLAAAHEKHIVHRDLKPENIFVTKDGRVKILDFGLAKLTQPKESSTDVTSLPTETGPAVVMGTIGYMSPEQISAKPPDPRSDIFALGAILYEILSGKRAFHRETTVETLNAILKEDPPRLLEVVPNLPPAVERIVHFCMEKNPDHRFQSARDLALSLEVVSTPGGTATAAAVSPRRQRMKVRWIVFCALLLLAVVASFFAGKERGFSDAGSKLVSPPSFHPLTFRRGTVWNARFTPDGFTILYSASWEGKNSEIFSTRPDSLESRSLGLGWASLQDISSSGELAVSLFPGWRLAKVPLGGGAPREIAEKVQTADWTKDGKELVIRRTVDPPRLEFPIGKVIYQGDARSARVSLKGDQVAFYEFKDSIHTASLCIIDRSGKKKILSGGWLSIGGVAWSPSGEELWFRGTNELGDGIYAANLAGQVRLLMRMPQMSVRTLYDVSKDGRLLMSQGTVRVEMSGLVPAETQERDLSWLDWSVAYDLSDDGGTLLFGEEGLGGGKNYGVYLRKLDGSPAVQLGDGSPIGLSPDGKWVLVFLPTEKSQLALLPTGAGQVKPIKNEGNYIYSFANWFPDGKKILIEAEQPGRASRLYIQGLDGGKPQAITAEGVTVHENPRAITRDGKWVLALGPGRWFLYPMEGGTPRPVQGLDPARDEPIQWSNDGRSLYVGNLKLMAATIYKVNLETGHRELWKELKPSDPSGALRVIRVLMTPDGKSYVYSYGRELTSLYMIEGLH